MGYLWTKKTQRNEQRTERTKEHHEAHNEIRRHLVTLKLAVRDANLNDHRYLTEILKGHKAVITIVEFQRKYFHPTNLALLNSDIAETTEAWGRHLSLIQEKEAKLNAQMHAQNDGIAAIFAQMPVGNAVDASYTRSLMLKRQLAASEKLIAESEANGGIGLTPELPGLRENVRRLYTEIERLEAELSN